MNPYDLLPLVGMGLQWARAQQRFAEIWYLAVVAVAAVGFYALGHPTDAFAQRWDIVVAGCWVAARDILSMTQLTSSGANVIRGLSGESGRVPHALPITNSQP